MGDSALSTKTKLKLTDLGELKKHINKLKAQGVETEGLERIKDKKMEEIRRDIAGESKHER